ncbi:hypothetical protein ACJMK2_011574 [Sinanodonta woodiana]|uniref:Uncharacterized protein n=1 Tax=Sinanodonta woodiana TaxID=1069815 RepID=A0ABD3V7T8_SINWO
MAFRLPRLRRSTKSGLVFMLLAICIFGIYISYKQVGDGRLLPRLPSYKLDQASTKKPKIAPELDHRIPSPPVGINLKKHLEVALNSSLHNAHNQLLKNSQSDLLKNAGQRVLENAKNDILEEDRLIRLRSLIQELYPANWKTAMEPDDMLLQLKSELEDLGIYSGMSCQEIDKLKLSNSYSTLVGKKYVDRISLGNVEIIIKSTGQDHDMKIECMKADYNAERCSALGNYKIMREVVFFAILQHPGIAELKGFCLRGQTVNSQMSKKGAILVMPNGEAINYHTIAGYTWQKQLEYSIRLMDLLDYLEHSPIGTLGLTHFEGRDIMLFDDMPKLVDLDDFIIGDKPCQQKSECVIQNNPQTELKCVDGKCKGFNAKNNMYLIYDNYVKYMLAVPPNNEKQMDTIKNLMTDLQNLAVTAKEVAQTLSDLLHHANSLKIPKQDAVQQNHQPGRNGVGNAVVDIMDSQVFSPNDVQRDQNAIDIAAQLRKQNEIDYRKRQDKIKQNEQQDLQQNNVNQVLQTPNYKDVNYTLSGSYFRVNQSNFPGVFDYVCQESRVTWGCVMSVRSLSEAKNLCDKDQKCKAFVLFSTKPEMDGLMTMVLKNSVNDKPQPNYGATLFMKGNPKNPGGVPINQQQQVDLVPSSGLKANSKKEVVECEKTQMEANEKIRFTREKRLMAHLGLKGIQEGDWERHARLLKISSHSGLSDMAADETTGGRFKVELTGNNPPISKAEFVAEAGPRRYHLGLFITYYLDRTLGIFHTPPTTIRKLQNAEFFAVQGDASWVNRLSRFNVSGGSGVLGLMTVPVPSVMDKQQLTLEQRPFIVEHVRIFNQSERNQLEYILLWALTKQLQPQHGYIGYKGHLVNFEADLAFQDPKRDMSSFFNNCQFPSVVYKVMNCYKCAGNSGSSICSLGQKILNLVLENGFTTDELKIGEFRSVDLKRLIDSAATDILSVVDRCISMFGRDTVLY